MFCKEIKAKEGRVAPSDGLSRESGEHDVPQRMVDGGTSTVKDEDGESKYKKTTITTITMSRM